MSNTFLAVIVPMYNEERNAANCVRAFVKTIVSLGLKDTRLFVVNDGSKDSTLKILLNEKQNGVDFELITYENNRGYGGAVSTGYQQAFKFGYEFGLVMDSDLTNNPLLIRDFYQSLHEGNYDFIKASRYIKGGGMKGVPWQRQLPTIVGNWVAYVLFGMGIHDCTNGFRCVRLRLVKDYVFQERGFPSILEELVQLKRKRAKGIEIPYTLTARSDGEENSKFSYSIKVFIKYLKYAILAFRMR